MKKLLIGLLLLTSVVVYARDINVLVTGQTEGVITNKNLVQNSGFEKGLGNWTPSAGTLSVNTTLANVGSGKQSAKWITTAASQTLKSDLVAIPAGLYGQNGLAQVYLQTAATDFVLSVSDGTNTLASLTIVGAGASQFQAYQINFVYPSSNNIQLVLTSASAQTIYIDDAFLNSAINISNVSQAQFVGSLNYAAATNCQWSRSSATFGNFSADTDCATPTVTGSASAPATKIPGITFTALPPGRYKFKAIGSFFDGVDNSEECYYRFSDGTNNMQSNGIGAAVTVSPLVEGEIEYSTAQSNITIQIQARAGVSQACDIYAAREGFYITVERIPTASQQAVTPDTQAMSWTGYHDGNCQWTKNVASVSTFVEFDPDLTACTFSQRTNQNFGTVTSYTSGGNSLPGIVFTPTKTGQYLACANLGGISATGANTTAYAFQLQDGNGTVISTQGFNIGPSNQGYYRGGYPLCGIININSLASTTLRVRGAGASARIDLLAPDTNYPSIEWSIVDISQNLPAPVLVGSVTSNSSGAERIERAKIGRTAGACSITTQSGSWLSSATANGTGVCDLVINNSIFSAEPTCNVTMVDAANQVGDSCFISTATAPSATFLKIDCGNTVAHVNHPFEIVCMGPR